MAKSNIQNEESSPQDGMPVECYRFTHDGTSYLYTSKREEVQLVHTEEGLTRTEVYHSDHIRRSEVKPGSSGAEVSLSVEVSKDHPVAKLYQGAPPEKPVTVKILRLHTADYTRYDVIFYGRVTQVVFQESICTLTAKLEDWLHKEVPNGNYQYFCNNVLYDVNCRLQRETYQTIVFLDKVDELKVYSEDFAKYADGYFSGGMMYFDGSARTIAGHKGNVCVLKYPFTLKPRNEVIVAPGCDHRFRTCVQKFDNALNFTGCPYIPPTDSEKNPTGKGAYWIDSDVVQRDTDGFVGTIEI